jgi:hypothetical protein
MSDFSDVFENFVSSYIRKSMYTGYVFMGFCLPKLCWAACQKYGVPSKNILVPLDNEMFLALVEENNFP